LKASRQKALAAALILGAAVFSWPVQALQCPMPPYSSDAALPKQMHKAASEYAKKRIAEMQSIFLGRIVFAEHVPFRGGGGVYVLTYEVSQWFKGRGGSHAKIIWYDAIPCGESCPIEERIRSFKASRDSAIVFVDPFERRFPFVRELKDHIDGENRPCDSIYLRQMSNEPLPDRADPTFGEVTFRNELRAWLKMSQAGKPQSRH